MRSGGAVASQATANFTWSSEDSWRQKVPEKGQKMCKCLEVGECSSYNKKVSAAGAQWVKEENQRVGRR